MQLNTFEKLGGDAIIVGSILFAIYSSLYAVLLPIGMGTYDYVRLVKLR